VRGLEGPSLVIDIRLGDALIHSVTLRQFCEAMVPAGVQFCLSQYEHSPTPIRCCRSCRSATCACRALCAGPGSRALRDAMRTSIDRAHRQGCR
jgi:hypothetical protein